MTSAGVAYWLDVWNWIDLSAVGLVVSSSIKFLQNDGSAQKSLLMTTGFFQFILLISYLKKTFFPFSKFVFGIIEVSCMGDCYSIRFFSTMATDGLHCTLRKIFWYDANPNLVSFITLFAFSFSCIMLKKVIPVNTHLMIQCLITLQIRMNHFWRALRPHILHSHPVRVAFDSFCNIDSHSYNSCIYVLSSFT